MNEFLKIYSSFHNNSDDILYYYIFDDITKSSAFVFAEYNSFFSNDKNTIVGKCMYINAPTMGINDKYYKNKNILGKDYMNIGYRKRGNEYIINSDKFILSLVEKNNLFRFANSNSIFSTNYSVFDIKSVKGVSEPRKSLKMLYKKEGKFEKIIDNIMRIFKVDIDDLGLTGSLSLGSSNASDYDIVFYGNISKLNLIKERIDFYKNKNGHVIEYGVNWPCRFYDDDCNLICCFFNCTDNIYEPIKNAVIVKENYSFEAKIIDDTFSILKAPILRIDEFNYDNIILFNSGFKGILKTGDIINGVGKIIRYNKNGKCKYSILCTNPYDELILKK